MSPTLRLLLLLLDNILLCSPCLLYFLGFIYVTIQASLKSTFQSLFMLSLILEKFVSKGLSVLKILLIFYEASKLFQVHSKFQEARDQPIFTDALNLLLILTHTQAHPLMAFRRSLQDQILKDLLWPYMLWSF